MDSHYSGIDILQALEGASHYNGYLTALVRQAAGDAGELVDFGAGIGTFAKKLREFGYHVICVEPDTVERARLIAHGFDAFASIDDLADNSVRFVFSLNVLEHIEDDKAAVSSIHRKLRRGGVALIYVPAFDCLWSTLDDKVHHYRRYTRHSLQHLITEAGFSIKRIRYADSLGFFISLAFRLLRRKADTITIDSVSFYDRWIFRTSRALDKACDTLFGKNVYAIVCKDRDSEPR